MKIRRAMIFHLVCALSLLMAAAMLWLWIESFQDEFHHITFAKADARYTLRSRWGQIVWFGPPKGGQDDDWMVQAADRMNNDDFEWKPISARYLEGTLKKRSATREVWDSNWQLRHWAEPSGRILDEKSMKARTRLFLKAMEDPRKFLPAHFMLLCAAEEKRQDYFHRQQQWRDASFRRESQDSPEEPILYMRSDAAGKSPDLSNLVRVRQEWHDVLDMPRWSIFHGWVFLAFLILPFAWLSHPRRVRFNNGRWFHNWLALVSIVVFLAATGMWIRSRFVDEQWSFASQPSSAANKWNYQLNTHAWIGSSKGMLIWAAFDLPEDSPLFAPSAPWGYQQSITLPLLPANIGPTVGNQQKMHFPGFELHVMPPQLITVTTPARVVPISNAAGLVYPPGARITTFSNSIGPAYPPGATMTIPGSTFRSFLGFRGLTIRWWLLVAVSAIAPAIWIWGASVRWKRLRIAHKLATRICLNCGYDMRATPDRCPECGHIPPQPSPPHPAIAMP